jgi:hypothetical protein
MRNFTLLTSTLALALIGCGDNNDPGNQPDMSAASDMATPIPTNFDSIYSQVLGPSCGAFSVCHTVSNKRDAANLALNKAPGNDPYAQLVGVAADNARAKGEGLLRVKPCDADHSFLVMKLELARDFDDKTDYGYRMPASNPPLDPAVIKAIRDWINRGALRDEPAGVKGSQCELPDGGN